MNTTVLIRAGWIFCLFLIQLHPVSADGVEVHLKRMKAMQNTRQVSAYPNPFDQFTTLTYQPVKTGFVRIAIYSAQGTPVGEVYDDLMEGGLVYQFQLTGEELEPGVYWCSIEMETTVIRQRLEIIR